MRAGFMANLFYKLGKLAGPKVRKGKWMLRSFVGSEKEAIEAEYDVGKDLADEVRQRVDIDPSDKLQQWLGALLDRLAGCVTNKARQFHVEALAEGEPNAFALPGGFIFITRPLVTLCEADPHEVSFILAHEMAHIMRKHAIDRVISSSAMAAAARTTPVRGMLGAWLRKVGLQFVESAYSQDHELEADELGARLVDAAGLDPRAAIRMLTRLKAQANDEGESTVGQYFATHPPYDERIRCIERLLAAAQHQGPQT